MNSITQHIKKVAFAGLIPVMLTSCFKDKPFPLYGNRPSAVIDYTYAATADTLQDKTYAAFISSNGGYFCGK